MTKRTTKKALVLSLLSLLLCCSMLVGTTFAWFTDSVTSGQNEIAGNLDVDVYYGDPADEDSIKDVATLFNDVTLWEPGALAWENLTVVNLGSLALKYQMSVNFDNENTVIAADGTDTGYKLSDILQVAVVEGGVTGTTREAVLTQAKAATIKKTLAEFQVAGELKAAAGATPAETDTYGLVIWWEPSAEDNNWNIQNGKTTSDDKPLHIDMGIELLATQLTYENDSFGSDYDAQAVMPNGAHVLSPMEDKKANAENGTFAISNEEGTFKVSGVTDNATDEVTVNLKPADASNNVVVDAGTAVVAYDIDVEGQTDGSNVKVELFIGKDLAAVELYHEGQKMAYDSYNSLTGYLTFTTTSFSNYTVKFGIPGEYAPLAKVTVLGPTEIDTTGSKLGLDLGKFELDMAYQFEPSMTLEEAQKSPYRYWHADFVVSCDQDIDVQSIALAGYYDAWCSLNNDKWVALSSDSSEIFKAGDELRLVYAMGGGGISVNYEELCRYGNDGIGFRCGIENRIDKLQNVTDNDGKIVTVELRLYETEEPSAENGNSHNKETGKYIVVGSYSYTLEATATHVSTGEELQDAVNNGDGYIVLDNDLDLSQGLVIPGN